jgi:hypothetical protein
VRVAPFKSTLKEPGIKLLKLNYDKPHQRNAFKFNLRRYIEDVADAGKKAPAAPVLSQEVGGGYTLFRVGAFKLELAVGCNCQEVRARVERARHVIHPIIVCRCSSRHPTYFKPPFHQVNGIL